jgi:hypothetical protein
MVGIDLMTVDADFAPLGNTTKFASPSHEENPIILRFYMQSLSRELLPRERVCSCMRSFKPGRRDVEVHYFAGRRKAGLKGLMRCASVWVCPVCGAAITETRRNELTLATSKTKLTKIMFTYTLSHSFTSPLELVLDMLITAYRAMKAGKVMNALRKEIGWIGSVKALEVTHGKNGWHPHIHELAFFDGITDEETRTLARTLNYRWRHEVDRVGGVADAAHGFDLRSSDRFIADYIQKFGRMPVQTSWSVEHELTKQPVKRGKAGGRTPMQLLFDYGAGDIGAGVRYKQYAAAFKGKQQLQWSRGLRELLGMNEPNTDEEIAEHEERDPTGELLATIGAYTWRQILIQNKRGELLTIAATGDKLQVRNFIADVLGE